MQQSQVQESKTKSKTKNLKQADIVKCILEDHKPLKKLIKIMKDSDKDIAERIAAFEEFAPTLVAHAKPEEKVLYTFMKEEKDLREMGFEGDVEHNIADQLVKECKNTKDEDLFSARVKVLAELVEHHIEEEEEELLPEFKKKSTVEERSELGNEFLELKEDYLVKNKKGSHSKTSKKQLQ